MQGNTGRRGKGLAKNEINAQEMGGQEDTFIPLWKEYSKEMKERMLHDFSSSRHTAFCRTVRNTSMPYLTHLFMSRPLGLSAGRGEKWLEIHNTNHRGKDFTTLYMYRIDQTCLRMIKILCLNLRALM